jgi:Holliday junction resolvase
MGGFDERLAQGEEHERAVLDRLHGLGWMVIPFGQGLLRKDLRKVLRDVDTNVRWCPDMLAVKGRMMVSVDAKAGVKWRETGNHAVEIRAVRSLDAWIAYSGYPAYIVFSDFRCATPAMIKDQGRKGKYQGSGSGTPFMVISSASCDPFDDVFLHLVYENR